MKMKKKIQIICACVFVVAAAFLIAQHFNERRVPVPEAAVREPIDRVVEVPPVMEVPTDEPPTPEDEPTEVPVLLPRIAMLREVYDNPDIVGFIEIPGTAIAYPVAQTGNNVFYLYHDLHWNPSNAGSIFLDYENNLYALADDNTIIYGHNMRNGSMFHNVRFFHQEDFFRAHTYILLDTPYKETVWDIFAFFHTTIAFDYLTTNFHDREAYGAFLEELQRRSHFETDFVLTEDDRILILSTCGVTGGDNRYVLVARLRI